MLYHPYPDIGLGNFRYLLHVRDMAAEDARPPTHPCYSMAYAPSFKVTNILLMLTRLCSFQDLYLYLEILPVPRDREIEYEFD